MIFHVLILYPEHLAEYHGEAYLWSCEADDEVQAVHHAKQEMLEANDYLDEVMSDLVVSLIVKGGEVL